MIAKLTSAWLLMALCVGIHTVGLTLLLHWIRKKPSHTTLRFLPAAWLLVRVAGTVIFLHLGQISVWAFYYTWSGAMPDLTAAFYFSAVTYTTTGYGDLLLPPDWRLVGGVEALTGILMCGLSTGLFFAVFSRIMIKGRDHSSSSRPPDS